MLLSSNNGRRKRMPGHSSELPYKSGFGLAGYNLQEGASTFYHVRMFSRLLREAVNFLRTTIRHFHCSVEQKNDIMFFHTTGTWWEEVRLFRVENKLIKASLARCHVRELTVMD